MKSRAQIEAMLNYVQTVENNALQFDEEAILRAYETDEDNQSLGIKVLSVFGGILASLAFCGFFFVSGLYDSTGALLMFGVLLIGGAIVLATQIKKVIIDTLSVSSFIIGLLLFGFGLAKLELDENTLTLVFMAIGVGTLSITRNYILCFVSVLVINGSFLTLIISNDKYDVIHFYISLLTVVTAYFFLNESKIIAAGKAPAKLYSPVRIGLIFSLLSALFIVGKKGIFPLLPHLIWLSSISAVGAIIFLLPKILDVLEITSKKHRISIAVFSLVALSTTALCPAISGAMLIVLLSFFTNYKTGLAIGIIAFIYFVSQYYYDLSFTLLTKSILMFSTGILLAGFYLLTYKKLMSNEKV
ncbi:MAG: DUF4401 domain-containing protein [Bacteroidetes bacterium]|nr:MAG: DUF4401 domain-containing protein [Bacteroidota bacterium]